MWARLRKIVAVPFFIPLCIFAGIFVSLFLLRPRPLRENSVGQLVFNAEKQRQTLIIETLRANVNRYNTNQNHIIARWEELTNQLIDEGVSSDEATEILRTARQQIDHQLWPISVERGWIQKQQVWIVIAGWPDAPPQYIDPVSRKERQKDDIERFMRNTQIAVISGKRPYRLLTKP